MHDRTRHRVEELAIVRDEEDRAREGLEPVLEPEHGVEVEVVRGLVEEEKVRSRHERAREVEAHTPAAGELRDGPVLRVLREAEAREERLRARARAIAADLLEARV